MKIKGIVFDKDGTLISYEACWLDRTTAATKLLLDRHGANAAYEPIMKRMGVQKDGIVDISGSLCHSTYEQISCEYAEEMQKIGVKTERKAFAEELMDAFNSYKNLSRSEPTAEGIRELFLFLKGEGIKLGLVTTDNREGAERTLSPLGVFDLFDTVLVSDGIHKGKPDPYYMRVFLKEHGLSPSEVLMVGDTETDMLFGRNSGTHTLGVGKTERNRKILSSLAEFTAADVLKIPEIIKQIT